MFRNAPAHHYQERELDFITLILGQTSPQKPPAYVIGMGITDSWPCQQGTAQGWKRKADSRDK